ncbi:hypothetical protein [Nakamurella sp.]|uniref:hypothetical protein n=1 Tax=Nakamurella sp. TaxID=1869182 RepID=UPI00378386CB
MVFDFVQFVDLRLNEHAMHTSEVDVTLDPDAVIPPSAAGIVVDNLDLIARFTAKPTGDTTTITAVTSEPERRFTVELTPKAVTLTPTAANPATTTADLQIPAEAFARLVSGAARP